MTAKVERAAAPLREFASAVAEALTLSRSEYWSLYAPRANSLGFRIGEDDLWERGAWVLVAQWLVAYATGIVGARATLAEAEEWFLGGASSLPRVAPSVGISNAPGGLTPDGTFALLPYLLDPLSPGTRRTALKRSDALPVRRSRKASGIYYTPADLADHMAKSVAPGSASTCLDPACGSGVFLRAARSQGGDGMAVFGCDNSPLAAEQCAFVLLATDLRQSPERSAAGSPWALWHLHRLNLATVDSLLLVPGSGQTELKQRRRGHELAHVRNALRAGEVPAAAEQQETTNALGDLFPDLRDGAATLLCNPPYTRLGHHPHADFLGRSYASLTRGEPSPAAETSTPFIEHSWRLTERNEGRAALVVPLSVAFNSGAQFRALRRAMAAQPGRWSCAFFDRAPDALFGDDVKTRNAVLVYDAGRPKGLETTSTLRWTSRNRAAFFASIRHVEFDSELSDDLIPRLGSQAEVRLYRAVRSLSGQLDASLRSLGAVSAAEAATVSDPCNLYVAPTAYNWFNCARELGAWQGPGDWSSSPFTRLELADEEAANAAFALLGSRLVLWLWRVEGDAFHVPRRFLLRLPFSLNSLAAPFSTELARLGSELWAAISAQPLISVNKGKQTLGFCAQRAPNLVSEIDALLLAAFDLTGATRGVDLAAWYERMVVVDAGEAKRVGRLRLGGGPAGA